jgi:hypothetical protein
MKQQQCLSQAGCQRHLLTAQCNQCPRQAPHISLALSGVEIISNGSGSHHQLRKLDTRLDLICSATAKAGGVYLYANQQVRFGGGDRGPGDRACQTIQTTAPANQHKQANRRRARRHPTQRPGLRRRPAVLRRLRVRRRQRAAGGAGQPVQPRGRRGGPVGGGRACVNCNAAVICLV